MITSMKTDPGCSNTSYSTLDFNGKGQEKVCQVCGCTPAGNHFDVVSCRPCSAFFRRTVVLKRNFVCKLKGNCPINKNIRSLCSHCRFKKCLNLGMSEKNINVHYEATGVPSRLPTDLKTSKTPLIDEMFVGFKKFVEEAKKVFFVCNPEELFHGEDIRFKPGTVGEATVFSRSLIIYTLEMILNHYHPFRDVQMDFRDTIFFGFGFQFAKLFTLYLNTLYFADDDEKLVTHYGRYAEKHNHNAFFETELRPKESLKYFLKIHLRMFKLSAKFKELKVTETEVVALSGLLLWKEVHYHLADLRYQEKVDQILAELSWHERELLGDKAHGERVGRICCIMQDIEFLSMSFHETKIIGALLNDGGPPKLADLDTFKRR